MSAEVQQLFDSILDGTFTSDATGRAWAALKRCRQVPAMSNPAARTEKLAGIPWIHRRRGNAPLRAANSLAGSWKVVSCVSNLCSLAAAPDVTSSVRNAAFDSLRKIGGVEAIATLQPWTRHGEPMERRRPAVLALAAIDLTHAGPPAISLLLDLTNQQAELSVWRSLLGNAGAGAVLATALPKNGFPSAPAKAGLRAEREAGGKEPELVVALTRAAGLQGGDAELSKAELEKLAESIRKDGDAARGERIFRTQQQSCATCHAIGGVGGHVGPDLTSLGASSELDYLIESVLYPNKEIKDGFQSCLVETRDGEEMAGIPVRENDRELVLRTASDQEATIAKSQIVSRKTGGSLMPSGLADNLSMKQQLDLFRFLSELGKPGPFDASSGNVARSWKVAPYDGDTALLASGLAGDRWRPVASLVDGTLLREDLQSRVPPGATFLLAGARFRTATAGPVHFDLPPDGSAWIDGMETALHSSTVIIELPAGTHAIILKFEAGKLPESFRLQSTDATFLTN